MIFPYTDDEGSYERTRAIGEDARQPRGRKLSCWWPAGHPERSARVIVCEGEGGALVAGTAEQVRAEAERVGELVEQIESDKELAGSDRRVRDGL